MRLNQYRQRRRAQYWSTENDDGGNDDDDHGMASVPFPFLFLWNITVRIDTYGWYISGACIICENIPANWRLIFIVISNTWARVETASVEREKESLVEVCTPRILVPERFTTSLYYRFISSQ